MKIVISGPAEATDRKTGKPLTKAKAKKLDGLGYTEDTCLEYLDERLAKLELTGGIVRLAIDGKSGELRVVTDYWADRALKANELKLLAKETAVQWSDGIGESSFWSDHDPDVKIDLAPLGGGEPTVEQIDEPRPTPKPAKPRLSLFFKQIETANVEKVRKLLEKGESLHGVDKYGKTILQAAARGKSDEIFQMLIDKGADVREKAPPSKDSDCGTALHSAVGSARSSSLSRARILLEKGADVNAVDKKGWSPLMWAAGSENTDKASLMLEHGADPNMRSTEKYNEGITALMLADSPAMIDLLLEHGADFNYRTDKRLNTFEYHVWQACCEGTNSRRYRRGKPALDHVFKKIREAADRGHAPSQYTLGEILQAGKEIPAGPSPEAAFSLYLKSAEGGYRMAMAKLGLCYLQGIGTAIDRTQAEQWLRAAADKRVPLAIGLVGEHFYPKDSPEAFDWSVRGTDESLLESAGPDEFAEFRIGVAANMADTGDCLENGRGTVVDLTKALALYERALSLNFHHVKPAIERLRGK
jgi:TPR repeat protein